MKDLFLRITSVSGIYFYTINKNLTQWFNSMYVHQRYVIYYNLINRKFIKIAMFLLIRVIRKGIRQMNKN